MILEKSYSDTAKDYLESVKDRWRNTIIPIMSEDDMRYFTDVSEYDADGTTMYAGKTDNPSMFYKWIRMCLRTSFNVCKEYFAPGLCMIFVNELIGQNHTALNNVDSEISEIIEYILKNEDKTKVGKRFEGISKDNITLNTLKDRYENIIGKSNSDKFKNLNDEDIAYEKGHKYEHHLIKTVEDLNPFEELITNPNDQWCIFDNETAFSSYTNGGKYNFHLFVRDDAYGLERPDDSGNAADDYGLSCFAVIVKVIEDDETGERIPSITNCTARYNHSVMGSDDSFLGRDMARILSITGFKKSVFIEGYVISLREIIESCTLIYAETDFITVKCRQESGMPQKPFIVIDNSTGKLLSKGSVYNCVSPGFDGNGLCSVTKDGKCTFINTEGRQIGDWYDRVSRFGDDGFAIVGNGDKLAFINTEGKQIGDWYDSVSGFDDDGLCSVKKDGKRTFINTEGRQIGDWYDDILGSFADGYVEVVKDGERFRIDQDGNRVAESAWYYAVDTVPVFESFLNGGRYKN